MSDQYAKGTDDKIEGKVQEEVGKLTGDRSEVAKGKGKQVKGDLRQRLSRIQDAARKP